jgi:hypothetical protein
MRHWMFRCDEVSQKISRGMDAPQSLGTRLAIRFHLWMCGHCSHAHRQLHLLRKISRQENEEDCTPDLPVNLSPAARQRIKEKLRACK